MRAYRGKVFDVWLAALNIGHRPAAAGALLERHLDGFVDLGKAEGERPVDALWGTPGTLVRLQRLLVLIRTAKGRGLPRGAAFQLLDAILELTDALLKLENPLRLNTSLVAQSSVLGFELTNALILQIGVHATLPTPPPAASGFLPARTGQTVEGR